MKESKLLASFQVPVLLIVPPLNRIALLLADVLPLQVVLLTLTMRPSSISFRSLPVMDSPPANWVVAAPMMSPPDQVLKPLSVRLPGPLRVPPDKSRLVIPALKDKVEFPLLIIALSLMPGTPVGDQFVSTPNSPVPPNHVRSTARAGCMKPEAASAAAIGNTRK